MAVPQALWEGPVHVTMTISQTVPDTNDDVFKTEWEPP